MQMLQHPGSQPPGNSAVRQKPADPIEQGGIGRITGQSRLQLHQLLSVLAATKGIDQFVFRDGSIPGNCNSHGACCVFYKLCQQATQPPVLLPKIKKHQGR